MKLVNKVQKPTYLVVCQVYRYPILLFVAHQPLSYVPPNWGKTLFLCNFTGIAGVMWGITLVPTGAGINWYLVFNVLGVLFLTYYQYTTLRFEMGKC